MTVAKKTPYKHIIIVVCMVAGCGNQRYSINLCVNMKMEHLMCFRLEHVHRCDNIVCERLIQCHDNVLQTIGNKCNVIKFAKIPITYSLKINYHDSIHF